MKVMYFSTSLFKSQADHTGEVKQSDMEEVQFSERESEDYN